MKKTISFILCAALAFCLAAGIPSGSGFSGTAITAEAASVSAEKELLPYYYGLMTKNEQRLYLQIRKAAMSGQPSVRLLSSLSAESYGRLIDTLFYSDPLTFNISAVDGMRYSGRTEIKFEYGIDNDQYKKMLAEMEAVSDKVNAKFKKNTSDYAKIKYIHDYLTANTDYNDEDLFSHYAYGALCSGKAVCDGYAGAFAYLCGRAGIPTVSVMGNAGGEYHTWNKVLCSGKWYSVDVTWDDPVTNFRENPSYNYFMISDDLMGLTHTEFPTSFPCPAAVGGNSYFDRNKLVASSITEAKSILTSQIVSAAKKGKLTASVRMTDEKTYKEVVSYFEKSNSRSALSMLASAKKKSGADIITGGMQSIKSDGCYTYTICIFYENTDISDYFNDPELLDKNTLEYFKRLGINVEKS